MCKVINFPIAIFEIQECLGTLDLNQDGTVSQDEFIEFMADSSSKSKFTNRKLNLDLFTKSQYKYQRNIGQIQNFSLQERFREEGIKFT